jgi:arsenite methyltransferase
MLARARLNASKSEITNVKFVESGITKIDLPKSSSDCVISNCAINLVPKSDKHLAFEEIFRILKPGGRVAISDTLARKPFPPELEENMVL